MRTVNPAIECVRIDCLLVAQSLRRSEDRIVVLVVRVWLLFREPLLKQMRMNMAQQVDEVRARAVLHSMPV